MKGCCWKRTRALKAIDERVTYELIGAWCSHRVFRLRPCLCSGRLFSCGITSSCSLRRHGKGEHSAEHPVKVRALLVTRCCMPTTFKGPGARMGPRFPVVSKSCTNMHGIRHTCQTRVAKDWFSSSVRGGPVLGIPWCLSISSGN